MVGQDVLKLYPVSQPERTNEELHVLMVIFDLPIKVVFDREGDSVTDIFQFDNLFEIVKV